MDSSIIKVVTIDEAIGLTTSNLSRRAHILNIHQKSLLELSFRKPLKYILSRYTSSVLFKSLEYAVVLWVCLTLRLLLEA